VASETPKYFLGTGSSCHAVVKEPYLQWLLNSSLLDLRQAETCIAWSKASRKGQANPDLESQASRSIALEAPSALFDATPNVAMCWLQLVGLSRSAISSWNNSLAHGFHKATVEQSIKDGVTTQRGPCSSRRAESAGLRRLVGGEP